MSDDTIYRALRDLGFSHLSARPKAYKQDPDAMEAFKKLCCTLDAERAIKDKTILAHCFAARESAAEPRQTELVLDRTA